MKKIKYEGKKNIIANKLKDIRVSKKITQDELASKLQLMNVGIDQQMISKIEKNTRQVTDYELMAICKCLGVSVEELTECSFK